MNSVIETGQIQKVVTRFSGQWEWCVELQRAESQPTIFLEYGPTAVVENARALESIDDPNYSHIFVTLRDPESGGIARIEQTEVTLDEMIVGVDRDDHRLRDVVLSIALDNRG